MRLPIDYGDLNKTKKKMIYPLPHIQSLLDCIYDSISQSSIDLCNGYWNLHIKEKLKEQTAFQVSGSMVVSSALTDSLLNFKANQALF